MNAHQQRCLLCRHAAECWPHWAPRCERRGMAVEAMEKTSMAAALGRGASVVGKTLLASAVLVAAALAASTAALASIVGRAGLAKSAAAWSRLGRLAVCDTSGDGGDLATAA